MREVAPSEGIAVLVWAVVQEMVIPVSEAIFIAQVAQIQRVMPLKESKAEAVAMEDSSAVLWCHKTRIYPSEFDSTLTTGH